MGNYCKNIRVSYPKSLINMARLTRFERVTAWFVARYSIQLSYRRVRGATIRMRSFRVKDL